jgi:Flp pilus assembly pilin Flp
MFKFLRGKARKGGLRKMLLDLHRDERGAEGLEKLLIIAALVIPLLGILIWYGSELKGWLEELWGKVTGKSGDLGDDVLD